MKGAGVPLGQDEQRLNGAEGAQAALAQAAPGSSAAGLLAEHGSGGRAAGATEAAAESLLPPEAALNHATEVCP